MTSHIKRKTIHSKCLIDRHFPNPSCATPESCRIAYPSSIGDETREHTAEQEVEKSNMEEPMGTARLAWIASELGSAASFPRQTIITQKR